MEGTSVRAARYRRVIDYVCTVQAVLTIVSRKGVTIAS